MNGSKNSISGTPQMNKGKADKVASTLVSPNTK
jgi:hypothetical protein